MLELQDVLVARGHADPYWRCRPRPEESGERGNRDDDPDPALPLTPTNSTSYADRGNIAVLRRRAERRLRAGVDRHRRRRALAPDCDLIYLGGGQDREQALIAPDLARRSDEISSALEDGAALLAVCGGYQLLGRATVTLGRGDARRGVLPLETVAGRQSMIGDVSIDCELDPGEMLNVVGFENHAVARCSTRAPFRSGASCTASVTTARVASRAVVWQGNGTYLHGPLLPRNPWLADCCSARRWRGSSASRPSSRHWTTSSSTRPCCGAETARVRGGKFR